MHLGNTVYRIHGTNAPETIGHAVSSGCFRLVSDYVADLYGRVPVAPASSSGRIKPGDEVCFANICWFSWRCGWLSQGR